MSEHRSGFVAMLGRPNAGKSTLVNALCEEKVSIVSSKPQTTRRSYRGIWHQEDAQLVFLDTPGIHKPVTAMGERLNSHAQAAAADADIICFLLDATQAAGKGDEFVLDGLLKKSKSISDAQSRQVSGMSFLGDVCASSEQKRYAADLPAPELPPTVIGIVTKSDIAKPATVVEQLAALAEYDLDDYVAVSAITGENLNTLRELLIRRLPVGPRYFPPDIVRDLSWEDWIAELVREQLLPALREELPHSVATRVEIDDRHRVRCDILVERSSQRPIVIGQGGKNLKAVREAVLPHLPEGAELTLRVKIDKHWQRRPERFGC